jgi:hypothetical protein
MSLKFAKITEENIDDLMSVCGNMPGMDKNPYFREGRQARREWLAETIKKFGTAGMLAFGMDGKAAGFVECVPASIHPLGVFSPDVKRTAVINCGWYKGGMANAAPSSDGEPTGIAIRKLILDEMLRSKFFDKLLGKKCRYVDVLTLKNAPIMQYDFYNTYGFKDAVELQGCATVRYLLRYPVMGDEVESRVEQVSFDTGEKNTLVLGTYRQCHMPYMVVGKIKKAVEGIDGLNVKVVDYWESGIPALCESSLNGKPAFDGPVFFMDDESICEAVRSKLA